MFQRIKEELSKSPVALAIIAILTAIMLITTVGMTWQRIGTPERTDITNNHYANNSQWQATVVFPNRGIPLEIEHFNYQKPFDGSSAYKADIMRKELSAQCLWWIPTSTTDDRILIISCFREKKPKYAKVPEPIKQ
jgi:hypothetical protein